MKKLVYTLTAIAALLSSCVKSADEQIVVEKSTTVAVEVAPAESRTFIGIVQYSAVIKKCLKKPLLR